MLNFNLDHGLVSIGKVTVTECCEMVTFFAPYKVRKDYCLLIRSRESGQAKLAIPGFGRK